MLEIGGCHADGVKILRKSSHGSPKNTQRSFSFTF